MRLPPAGLCSPVRFLRALDGDTIEIAFPGSTRGWKIRLIDCWAPEKSTEAGRAAKHFVESTLEQIDHLHVFIPAPEKSENLLAQLVTFDRILGHLFLTQDSTLSDLLVLHKHATRTKVAKA